MQPCPPQSRHARGRGGALRRMGQSGWLGRLCVLGRQRPRAACVRDLRRGGSRRSFVDGRSPQLLRIWLPASAPGVLRGCHFFRRGNISYCHPSSAVCAQRRPPTKDLCIPLAALIEVPAKKVVTSERHSQKRKRPDRSEPTIPSPPTRPRP